MSKLEEAILLAVQAPVEERVKPVETPPAPKPPAAALPEPTAKPVPKPQQASKEATAKTPSTGPTPQEGSTKAETQVRGQGFGLSSAGGAGGGAVTLDVTDFCCMDYVADFVRRIEIQWLPGSKQGIPGITMMKFTIARDGRITDVQVEKSSGFEALDFQARRALINTAKLEPLPPKYTNPTLTVHLEFIYQR